MKLRFLTYTMYEPEGAKYTMTFPKDYVPSFDFTERDAIGLIRTGNAERYVSADAIKRAEAEEVKKDEPSTDRQSDADGNRKGENSLNCPGCDKGPFATPQGLGAHRRSLKH